MVQPPFDPTRVVLITGTFYKEPESLRERLAQDMVRAARANHYNVVVVDDSPRPAVATGLKMLGAQVFPQKFRGMGAGRREAFFHAWKLALLAGLKRPIFLWLEPEKVDVVRLVSELVAPIVVDESEIVIMRRSEASFATYPKFQMESEKQANDVFANAIGRVGFDPMSGPVAWNQTAMPFFVGADGNRWGVKDTYIQHYAPMEAWGMGCHVSYVEVDFQYPVEQRAEEEGAANEAMLEKRASQLADLTDAYRKIGGHFRLNEAA